MTKHEQAAQMQTAQFDNPDAPDYDWKRDREWFNLRLADARIHNSELEQRIAILLELLRRAHKAMGKSAGMSVDTIQDKARFRAFLEGCKSREASLVADIESVFAERGISL